MTFAEAEQAFSQQDYFKASEICAHLLRVDPENRDALYIVAYIAYKKKDYERSITLSEYGLKINKLDPRFYNLIGLAYKDQGEFLTAFQILQDGLRVIPHDFLLYNNLGTILQILGSPEAAKQAFELSLLYRPDYPEALYNLGTVQLLLGEYEPGWKNYEARFDIYGDFDKNTPRWEGQPLDETERLLVYTEQGLGDTLQFIRYLPFVAQRVQRLVLKVQNAIYPFLITQKLPECIEHIYLNTETVPDFNYHCSLLSLPYIFKTTRHNIPVTIPYFQAHAPQQVKWANFLTKKVAPAKRFKIGIAWMGSVEHEANLRRSCPLLCFQPLIEAFPEIQFISLQKGAGIEQLETVPFREHVLNVETYLTDFNETAALIMQLDLIISIDTSIVHLAGGLGKTVWMINRYDTDFRWFFTQAESPWYPSLKIFRPQVWGDWKGVLEQVRLALPQYLSCLNH